MDDSSPDGSSLDHARAELAPDQRPENWSAGAAGYDRSFAVFTGLYADEAVRLLGLGPGVQVVEVAAGSGAFTLRAARAGAQVLATDFSPGMVDLLTRRVGDEALDVECAVMDGQALDLPDASFDVAVSMFGVIFFPDIPAGLRQLVRVTRPGGRVLVATWDLDGFTLKEVVGRAIAAAIPGLDAAGDGPPPPPWARLGEPGTFADALREIGLVDVDVHVVTRPWHFDDPEEFFRRLPDWSPPVQPLFAGLAPDAIERGARAFADALAEVGDDQHRLEVTALLGTGRRAPA